MQTWRTVCLAPRAWWAFGLLEACGSAAPQGDANGHLSSLADARADAKDDDDATPKDDSSEAGDGGLADSGTPPACTVDLSAIGCPESYGAALSSVPCAPLDNPRIGVCGGLRVYAFGHDGVTICAYDSSTDALAGGVSCGIPQAEVGSSIFCDCYTAGQVLPDSCRDPVTSACATDAGTD